MSVDRQPSPHLLGIRKGERERGRGEGKEGRRDGEDVCQRKIQYEQEGGHGSATAKGQKVHGQVHMHGDKSRTHEHINSTTE